MRAATAQLNERLHPWGHGPRDHPSGIDHGDCWLDHHRPATLVPSIEAHARTIVDSGATMLSLGGDHFITCPLLRAHASRHGAPVPGGLSSVQALAILRRLVPLNLVDMDVVEVAPPYDHAEITALDAAHVATEMLCLLAAQRR